MLAGLLDEDAITRLYDVYKQRTAVAQDLQEKLLIANAEVECARQELVNALSLFNMGKTITQLMYGKDGKGH